MKLAHLSFFRVFLTSVLIVLLSVTLPAQKRGLLRFASDKTFKIAQFTDIHWNNNSENCSKTIQTIEHVLKTEKPDLAILTGDIVVKAPAREGWLAVTRPFIDAEIPWTVTLGNHDGEPEITREEIFDLLEKLPWFAGNEGKDISGVGNYALPVKASGSGKVAAIIYCFDSNSYLTNKNLGKYDWIHYDQMAWYRKTSGAFTRKNSKKPLPSFAFFHIPIQEYNYITDTVTITGIKKEGVGSSKVNSGIFASFLEKGDIMGIFAGHDHNNNWIGIYQGIAIGYGQVSGADAYGDLPRGSRIITLKEDDSAFDTWISTPSGKEFRFLYPQGPSE